MTRTFNILGLLCLLLLGAIGGAGAQTIVCTGGQFYNQGIVPTGHNATTRQRHTFPQGSAGFYFVYSDAISGQGNVVAPSPITITASIELNNGYNTLVPVYFSGQRSVTIPVGGVVRSDFIAYSVSPNAYLWSRTYVSDGGNGRGTNMIADASQGNIVQEGTDDTYPASADSMVATAGALGFVPICVVGFPVVSGKPAIIGVGDSITAGIGDLGTGVARGYLTRSLGLSLPFVVIAQGGETISNGVGLYNGAGGGYSSVWFQRAAMAQYANDTVIMIGTNDVQSGATLTAMKTGLVLYWTSFYQMNTKVYACTIVPHTTSTDAWATTTNQTFNATDPVRTAANDWIRDGAPLSASLVPVATGTATAGTLRTGMQGHPLTGFFETADTTETARNSGLWRPSFTSDGIHPNQTGAAAMSGTIVVSQLAAPVTNGTNGIKRRTQ